MSKLIERVFKKKCTEAERSLSQQSQLVHCYGWVPRTLTYQRSLYFEGPTLQKINLVFLEGPSLYYRSGAELIWAVQINTRGDRLSKNTGDLELVLYLSHHAHCVPVSTTVHHVKTHFPLLKSENNNAYLMRFSKNQIPKHT